MLRHTPKRTTLIGRSCLITKFGRIFWMRRQWLQRKCKKTRFRRSLVRIRATIPILPQQNEEMPKRYVCVRNIDNLFHFDHALESIHYYFPFYLKFSCQMKAGAGLFGLLTRFTNDMMNDGHRDVIEDAMEIADKCVAPTPKFY